MVLKFMLFAMSVTLATGQRPGFAGSRPIGFPEVYNRTTTTAAGLQDRFGEGEATTQRLPIEAKGDRDLVDRLSKLPVDQQPFWFINWQALEANRNNPQSYPQKPNVFVDPIPNPGTNSPVNVPNSNSLGSSVASSSNRDGNQGTSSGTSNSNSEIKNRFSETGSSHTPGSSQVISNENGETESNAPVTRKTVHLPTHNHFRPTWLSTFKPRTPIIDN